MVVRRKERRRNLEPVMELPDGRVIDSATGQVDYQNESSVYLIKKTDGEELLVKSWVNLLLKQRSTVIL